MPTAITNTEATMRLVKVAPFHEWQRQTCSQTWRWFVIAKLNRPVELRNLRRDDGET